MASRTSDPGRKKRRYDQFQSRSRSNPNYNANHERPPYKKRKTDFANHENDSDEKKYDVLTRIKCHKPRDWTVSVALAGSVMETAKTPQLQTYLASQLARIISIFSIDEMIIFSETGSTIKEEPFKSDPNLFLFRMLQYLETPQLRSHSFLDPTQFQILKNQDPRLIKIKISD